MKDLLPPSPSVAAHGVKHSPAPSQHRPSPLVNDEDDDFDYGPLRTDGLYTRQESLAGDLSRSHSRSISSSSEAMDTSMVGPAIQPLDFASVILSHEQTHAALAHTVGELSQWLTVVESGFRHLLNSSEFTDTIDEELDDPFTDYFDVEHSSMIPLPTR
jgi:hypothetical protein